MLQCFCFVVLTLEPCKCLTQLENNDKFKFFKPQKFKNKTNEPNCRPGWHVNDTEKDYFKWVLKSDILTVVQIATGSVLLKH